MTKQTEREVVKGLVQLWLEDQIAGVEATPDDLSEETLQLLEQIAGNEHRRRRFQEAAVLAREMVGHYQELLRIEQRRSSDMSWAAEQIPDPDTLIDNHVFNDEKRSADE